MEIRKVKEDYHGIESFQLTYKGEFDFYGIYNRVNTLEHIKDFHTLEEARDFMEITKGSVLRIAKEHNTLSRNYTVKMITPGYRDEKWLTLDRQLWEDFSDKRITDKSKIFDNAIILPPVGTIVHTNREIFVIESYCKDGIVMKGGIYYAYDEIYKLNIVQKP